MIKSTGVINFFAIFPLGFALTLFYQLKVSTLIFEDQTTERCFAFIALTLN